MNAENFKLAESLVDKSYIAQASQARRRREKMIRSLLANRQLPDAGWDDSTIELFLSELAIMDSNNFVDNAGVGEREARLFSSIVRKRHFSLGHGIGRSGEIAATQPKAAGSSLLLKLTTALALHAIKLSGIPAVRACIVLPAATGMAHVHTLLALRTTRPNAKHVLWPRIDQKTCLKAITSAGCIPVVIENELCGDEVRTNMQSLSDEMKRIGPDNVLCVLSTSSCFAPRAPDRLVEIGQLCARVSVPHVVNNAYGLQTAAATALITSTINKRGRIDAFIQSTDKNFMVPVGGSIVAAFESPLIDRISTEYPGRASVSPILDLFITLLSMGRAGYERLLAERIASFDRFQTNFSAIAAAHNERLLITPNNPISLGITLQHLVPAAAAEAATTPPSNATSAAATTSVAAASTPTAAALAPVATATASSASAALTSASDSKLDHKSAASASALASAVTTVRGVLTHTAVAADGVRGARSSSESSSRSGSSSRSTTGSECSYLGSMLFSRCVSGTRVVSGQEMKQLCGQRLVGWGAHIAAYPHPYLTAAVAIGASDAELDTFLVRLDAALKEFKSQRNKTAHAASDAKSAAPQPLGSSNVGDVKSPAAAATAMPVPTKAGSGSGRGRGGGSAGRGGRGGRGGAKSAATGAPAGSTTTSTAAVANPVAVTAAAVAAKK